MALMRTYAPGECTLDRSPQPWQIYTSLVIDRRGEWLCPQCIKGPHDPRFKYLTHRGFVIIGVRSKARELIEVIRRQTLAKNWENNQELFYKAPIDEECALFANPADKFQCCFEDCTFDRTQYFGSRYLDEDTEESVAELRRIMGLSISQTKVFSDGHWFCPGCIIDVYDLRSSKSEQFPKFVELARSDKFCDARIWPDYRGFKPATYEAELDFHPPLRVHYNRITNGDKCDNTAFGQGPHDENEPCSYRLGMPWVFEPVPEQSNFLLGRIKKPDYKVWNGIGEDEELLQNVTPATMAYTGLLIDSKGRWLCPYCPLMAKEDTTIWPEAQRRGYVIIRSSDIGKLIKEVKKVHGSDYLEQLYKQVKDVKAEDPNTWVAYFANPSDVFTCLSRLVRGAHNKLEVRSLGKGCNSTRFQYPGKIEILKHLWPKDSFQEMALGREGQNELRTFMSKDLSWPCPKCSVDPDDLEKTDPAIRVWRNYIWSEAWHGRFQKVDHMWNASLAEGKKQRLCYINSMTAYGRPSYVCKNKKFGKGPGTGPGLKPGPDSENVPCGFTLGMVARFVVRPEQWDCYLGEVAPPSSPFIPPVDFVNMRQDERIKCMEEWLIEAGIVPKTESKPKSSNSK